MRGTLPRQSCLIVPGRLLEVRRETSPISRRAEPDEMQPAPPAEAIHAAIHKVKLTGPHRLPGPDRSQGATLRSAERHSGWVLCRIVAASGRLPRHPFLIEAAIAYGGSLPADESAPGLRFAKRVPLLCRQSSCRAYKAVVDTNWRDYELGQPKTRSPRGRSASCRCAIGAEPPVGCS